LSFHTGTLIDSLTALVEKAEQSVETRSHPCVPVVWKRSRRNLG